MILPSKQKAILDFARAHNNRITTKQANQLLDGFYYYNAAHYVSEILTRMVKSGKLNRIELGVYIIGPRKVSSAGEVQQEKLF